MVESETSLPEVVLRVTLIYAGLVVMVRIAGKREVGELGPLDLLTMLILSETVSPALTGQDTSLSASLTAAATLIALNVMAARLIYRSRTLERLIEGVPRTIIENGHLNRSLCEKEHITDQELAAALRREGVSSPAEVEHAVLEPRGTITVIRKARR
jgi:uncharacterized membrane protein YcaP (DUF421 family)